ncbi:ATP-binding cassette domain-containing protein [Catellatospora sp. IY07-71]|uniref:ATP-binding cassette domain-containing protein n=1 Tax=Catellatospora sp. IY07-71 TaxID=2728827 RepID=UPI001BB43A73|nr:ATP-binding cassette domain-containing protein [Catellatospora sp. IY07-71]
MRAFGSRLRAKLNRRWLAGGLAAAVLAGGVAWALLPADPGYRTIDERVTVRTGPAGDQTATLDTRLYLPDGASASRKVPALLLGHGFGGTKDSVSADAKDLAGLGYAVLTWTAQGLGASTGQIHLNSPDWEVKDAQGLLDHLAARPEIMLDKPGDPRAGAMGGSYGGNLSLMLAAQDPRLDAIVPMITWNDLGQSLFQQSLADKPGDGVLKQAWAGIFFGSGMGGGRGGGLNLDALGATGGDGDDDGDGPGGSGGEGVNGAGGTGDASGMPGDRGGAALDPQCGRWAADVCETYLRVAATGRLDDPARQMLAQRSPATVLSRIKAPTLLIQGETDSLFPLAEADANARGIAANGTPVRVAWFTGGHDGGDGPQSDQDRLKYLIATWFDHYLKGNGDAPANSFTYSRITGLDAVDRGQMATGYQVTDYPGLGGGQTLQVPVTGRARAIANPPNGTPAALSSLPGAGSLASLISGAAATDLPGQHARFESAPLEQTVSVVGAPQVSIKAASPTGEAVLFVKLYDVDPDGRATLSGGLVAPVRLTGLPAELAQAQPVRVSLPGIVHEIEAGHRLRVTIATADQSYLGPADPVEYTVAVGDRSSGAVTLPTVTATPIATADTLWLYVLLGLLALIALGLAVVIVVARRRHRRVDHSVSAEHADTPLWVRGLRKTYGDFVAVDEISFTVERGQVVGLLGPNGAGKTTSLRVLMGLTQATAGEVLIFGHRLAPGAPVLSRIGALVEGPGFLPHLTGEQNLTAYWRATGRPWEEAQFERALEIAGLGDAVKRKVKNYSHGMKQRLAVAQAMLGLPELLVLDEPTDGLDPPQIAEMRRVLQRYAENGRAVLVSSHLLAEVEQTCTHAVVVHKGRVVASGRVDEIVGDSPTTLLDVTDIDLASKTLDRLDGVAGYAVDGERTLVVDLGDLSRTEAVSALVRAGVGIDRVTPRRRLEDAFLALVGESTAGSGDR